MTTKGQGSLVYFPLSTGILQLIPKATADDIPIHSMGYGRISAADGNTFSHVFNFPGTYWDAASIIIKHMMDMEGGSLDGKKVALVYHNSAYGKEPIRTLEELSKNTVTNCFFASGSPRRAEIYLVAGSKRKA